MKIDLNWSEQLKGVFVLYLLHQIDKELKAMRFENITLRIEFVDYRGSVKTRDFTNLNYTDTDSTLDEVEHVKKVNNWQKIINVTPIRPKD